MNKHKPRIGIFSFTSCEGCQLQILNLEDEIPALINHIEIVNFREASSYRDENYEIAFVEGSITRESEIGELKRIRRNAKILVALGACAHLGGINNLKNMHPPHLWLSTVYGRMDLFSDTFPTRRIQDVVPVDMVIPGCPIRKEEFLQFVKALILQIRPRLPDYPVCVECRSRANICLVEEDKWCLGSITRAGCDALCPTYREACIGCRGLVENPNVEALISILKDKGYTKEEIIQKLTIFNAFFVKEQGLVHEP